MSNVQKERKEKSFIEEYSKTEDNNKKKTMRNIFSKIAKIKKKVCS